ncbi:hypothetical protein OsI_07493 [Oryza sativa Indica Group]|uniref:Uncharacterized protein n=1 Tax=Oryza sativa subsp. indica TaxID=39946 RepID=B8AIZ5_ORYSI|nr:hypothetical protein OsI_07493 [Oryza sativa Indica Group]
MMSRDRRYDSFKTWSGKLERQLAHLAGAGPEFPEEEEDVIGGAGASVGQNVAVSAPVPGVGVRYLPRREHPSDPVEDGGDVSADQIPSRHYQAIYACKVVFFFEAVLERQGSWAASGGGGGRAHREERGDVVAVAGIPASRADEGERRATQTRGRRRGRSSARAEAEYIAGLHAMAMAAAAAAALANVVGEIPL